MRVLSRVLFMIALGWIGRDFSAGATAPAASSGYGTIAPSPIGDTVYLFGWGYVPVHSVTPRGGSSEGGPVTLAPGRSLPLPEIAAAKDALTRDRAAILAL